MANRYREQIVKAMVEAAKSAAEEKLVEVISDELDGDVGSLIDEAAKEILDNIDTDQLIDEAVESFANDHEEEIAEAVAELFRNE